MTDAVSAIGAPPRGRSLTRLAVARLVRNRAAMASAIFLVAISALYVFGPYVYPHAYDQVFESYVRTPASLDPYPRDDTLREVMEGVAGHAHVTLADFSVSGSAFAATFTSPAPIDPRVTRYVDRPDEFDDSRVTDTRDGGKTIAVAGTVHRTYFPMGTDGNGRDLFARIMIGGRISLTVGILATFVSLVIGVVYGAISGFAGGRVDNVLMRLVEILYSLPFVFLVIVLVVFFGRNFILIFVAIGAIEWLDMARIVRGQTLSLKRREFVVAAEAMGLSDWQTIRRHIIPNTVGPVIVFVTILVPRVILLESFLSFLGLGVQEPLTSLGALIAEGAANIEAAPWLLIFPSIFFVATLFALNFLGDGLRDAFDPRDR
ncbi:MAG TPA: ABC transporter permease subunit [Bauldia sp.]|nr:ABC transporter permease subunit [Bauldia sp.]